uniref:Uncharacterized protein n=1 Tax=Candidatus Kentrum sp. LFY TaxID=2126342 RepID=A0A450WD32_9GAMM|nr:MAG: hypothetical protein BECKLFY1418C_GA0070996_101219 [Candidatus Kentron sp. LFY]
MQISVSALSGLFDWWTVPRIFEDLKPALDDMRKELDRIGRVEERQERVIREIEMRKRVEREVRDKLRSALSSLNTPCAREATRIVEECMEGLDEGGKP